MTRRWLQAPFVVVLLILLAAPIVVAQQGQPGNPGRETRIFGEMNGYQESVQPPGTISTTGFGEFEAMIDDETQTITFTMTYSNLEGGGTLFAHIHFGARNTTGGVSAFLCGGSTKPTPCPYPSGTVTGTIQPQDVIGPTPQGIEALSWAELVRAMRAGVTYANVHTTRWPAGEIRGQLNEHGNREFVD